MSMVCLLFFLSVFHASYNIHTLTFYGYPIKLVLSSTIGPGPFALSETGSLENGGSFSFLISIHYCLQTYSWCVSPPTLNTTKVHHCWWPWQYPPAIFFSSQLAQPRRPTQYSYCPHSCPQCLRLLCLSWLWLLPKPLPRKRRLMSMVCLLFFYLFSMLHPISTPSHSMAIQ